MTTLTLTEWLLIANLVFTLSLTLLVIEHKLRQKKNNRSLLESVTRLEHGHSAMSQTAIGIGRKIKQLEKQPAQAASRPLSENDDMRFSQASRLVGLGASADDLVENLGVARAEADLLVSLRGRATA